MTSRESARRTLWLVAAMTMLCVGLGRRPALAQGPSPDTQCFTQLTNCYYWAANQSGFWTMWAAGLDCELQLTACVRRAVLGM